MKKLLIITSLVLAFAACQKDYSLEYFKQYNADAPNRMMSKSKEFKSVESIIYKKYTGDLFFIRLYYWTNKGLDSSFAQFNHNGKMLTFVN
jgi:hypothetical protein